MMDRYTSDLEAAFEAEVARAEAQVPVCENCGKPVAEDFYYEINDTVICAECMDRHFRREVVVL